MDGTNRTCIKPGISVKIIQKQDQRSGKLTEGIVQKILTKSPIILTGLKLCWRTASWGV